MDPLSGSWMGVAVPEREIFGAPIDWTLEFKSTIRMNLKTEKFGKEIELAWLKSATEFSPLIRFQVQPIVSKLVVAVQCERSPRQVFHKEKQGGVLHPERTLERRAIPPGGPGLRRATRVSWRVTLFVVK
jgi:hypothetical protein